jgi:hypothetical protein
MKRYSKKYKQWVTVETLPLSDRDGNDIGEIEIEICEWMDEIDKLTEEAEVATLWASDNGWNIDDVYC